MNQVPEHALIGWKAIADMFRVTDRTMKARRKELFESGMIFYMNHGRLPRKRVCAFPSLLMRWTIIKGSKRIEGGSDLGNKLLLIIADVTNGQVDGFTCKHTPFDPPNRVNFDVECSSLLWRYVRAGYSSRIVCRMSSAINS